MKALQIIDLLTCCSNEMTGVITIDDYDSSNSSMCEILTACFGDGVESVYDPNDIFHLKAHADEKPRSFLYMYDRRFSSKYDKELFAVLSCTDRKEILDLIYIYEIE